MKLPEKKEDIKMPDVKNNESIDKLAQTIKKLGTTNLQIFNYFLKKIENLEKRLSKLEQIKLEELINKDCEKK